MGPLSCLPVMSVYNVWLWPNGWTDQDGTEVGLGPGHIVLELDGDLAPTERGTAAPTFRPMSIVAKRSPISATAGLLFGFALQ